MDGPGSDTDLARRIRGMSGGRLNIQVFGAGELIPAFEGFDAVRAGTVEVNHANAYFRTGKSAAAQYFTAVPFGMNFQGMNGWHEPATVSELLINKAAWDKLPADLKAIVQNAAAACNVIGEAWCQKNNSDAMEDLIKNQGVIARPLPDAVITALRTETDKVLAEAVGKDPMTRKVHDSYMAFKAKFGRWSEVSEEAHHITVRG